MRFEDALIELRKGKSIRRPCFLYSLNLQTPTYLQLMLNDLYQEDWEVVEEPGKTFPEVFDAFKSGKSIRRKSWSENFYVDKKGLSYSMESYNGHIDSRDLLANDWIVIEH